MSKYLVIVLMVSFGCAAPPVGTGTMNKVFYDANVKDSFEVRVDDCSTQGNKRQYKTILFYFDAGLKSGKQLRTFFKNETSNPNILLVGISHFGNYREKRRRDFMKDNEGMQHLLDSCIIPFVKQNFGWAKERIAVGHSFGGLWVYRKFFEPDTLFTTLIAVSPSVWYDGADEKRVLPTKINNPSKKLYMYWGGNEVLNYVRKSCRKVNTWVAADNSLTKTIYFRELKGKTHNTTLLPALEDYFGRK